MDAPCQVRGKRSHSPISAVYIFGSLSALHVDIQREYYMTITSPPSWIEYDEVGRGERSRGTNGMSERKEDILQTLTLTF